MILRTMVLAICLGLAAVPAAAQRLPIDDSLGISASLNSRLLWRGITLADAAGLETGLAIPLRPILRGLQLEVQGWTSIAERSQFRQTDQYAGSLHYQIPLRRPPRSVSLVLLYTEYLRPNADQPLDHSEEIGAKALVDFVLPQFGIRTIQTELETARDIGRTRTSWVHGAATISIGTTIDRVETVHTISAILKSAVSASDLSGPMMSKNRTAFGWRTAELELQLEHRLSGPARSFALTSAVRLGVVLRPADFGPDIGWTGLRESILFF